MYISFNGEVVVGRISVLWDQSLHRCGYIMNFLTSEQVTIKGEKTRRKRKNICFLLSLLSRMAVAFDACDNTVWLMRKVHGTLIKLWVSVCARVHVWEWEREKECVSTARERKLIKILCLSKAKLVRRMMPRPAATQNLNTFIAVPHSYTCITIYSLWNSFKRPKLCDHICGRRGRFLEIEIL